ncbi:MAG: hypothetical protein ACTSQP_23495 [Promethearchaeota archaeon]
MVILLLVLLEGINMCNILLDFAKVLILGVYYLNINQLVEMG